MEVRCPQCAQRLRYSDVLKNPTLRCRPCGTIFRPADLGKSDDPVVAEGVEESEELDDQLEPTAAPDRSGGIGKRGIGTFGIIAIVIALKVGPRLMREIFRDRPAQPRPPVRLHQENRKAIERLKPEDGVAEAEPDKRPIPFEEVEK
jgi:hypothetical protein